MESPESNVALVSRNKAEKYFQKENYGRAFAHSLLALKLFPSWKNELKALFTSSLCHWGEELEAKERYSDLFNCYEQALDVYPENEEVVNNLGAHLFRAGHLNEASFYFEKALKIKSDYIPAYRNLQSVSNLLVERWHFRMLNDAHRNEAYREAIFKKISQGFDFVLDIGTGTGLLSYFAVDGGARSVFACDYSQTMIDTAKKIVELNDMGDDIRLICKLSNNITIPDDIPRRVSLVVTETMDAGLLGENLLQTLLHAWEHLLLPPLPPATLLPPVPCIICRDVESCRSTRRNGIVLPFGASLWFAAVECSRIAQKYRLLSDKSKIFKGLKFPFLLTAKLDEPYDSENLKKSFGSYKFLCEPVHCFYINFNDAKELQNYYDGKYDDRVFKVKCSSSGSLDCFVFWFDLHLDEDIKLSSSPFTTDEYSNLCSWDQAIFPIQNEFRLLSVDSSVSVKVKTMCGKLSLDLCNVENQDLSLSEQTLSVSQDIIRFLNNSSQIKSFYSASELIKKEFKLLDLSPFPILYFKFFSDFCGVDNYVYVAKTLYEVDLIKKLSVANEIDPYNLVHILESDFEACTSSEIGLFDVIITNLFDSSGEFRENSIAQLVKLRKLLAPNGKIWPEKICVCGQLISSKWLKRSAKVLNEGLIEKYHIADFMNKHKVHQQLDLCLSSVEHSVLSEEFEILNVTTDDLVEGSYKEFHCDIPVIASGEATAIAYWFQCHLVADNIFFTTRDLESHINQATFMIEKNREVVPGDLIMLNGRFSDAGFMFKIE